MSGSKKDSSPNTARTPPRYFTEQPPQEAPRGRLWLQCTTCQAWFLRKASEHRRNLTERKRTGAYCSKPCTYANSLRSAPADAIALFEPDAKLRRAYSQTYQSARKNAGPREYAFDLSVKDYDALVRRAGGRCEVTGIAFRHTKTRARNKRHPYLPSVDRIDNTKPYTPDNVRLVLLAVNQALGDWGITVFDHMMTARLELLNREDEHESSLGRSDGSLPGSAKERA